MEVVGNQTLPRLVFQFELEAGWVSSRNDGEEMRTKYRQTDRPLNNVLAHHHHHKDQLAAQVEGEDKMEVEIVEEVQQPLHWTKMPFPLPFPLTDDASSSRDAEGKKSAREGDICSSF